MDTRIATERLMIKPYAECDFRAMAALLTNEPIKETYMIPDYPTCEALSDAVNRLYRASLSDEHFERGIYLGNALIGFVNDVDVTDNAIEIGYAIHPEYQNQGYATEMFHAVIQALLNAGYCAVIAGAFVKNAASIRVMQKCGLTKMDKEEDILYHGERMHCVYYRIEA